MHPTGVRTEAPGAGQEGCVSSSGGSYGEWRVNPVLGPAGAPSRCLYRMASLGRETPLSLLETLF